MDTKPNLIRRSCGGWLAVSPDSEPIKIGVTAPSREEVVRRFQSSLARWRELPSDAPASNHTSAET